MEKSGLVAGLSFALKLRITGGVKWLAVDNCRGASYSHLASVIREDPDHYPKADLDKAASFKHQNSGFSVRNT